jgi:hypothetical protein
LESLLNKWLDEPDIKAYGSIKYFLKTPLPEKTMTQYRPYCVSNIEAQAVLSEIQARLKHELVRRRSKLYALQSDVIAELKDDKFTSSTERAVLVFNSSKYADLREEYDGLEILIEHVKSLEWNLKSLMNAIS